MTDTYLPPAPAHNIEHRELIGYPYVTVAELHARLGVNAAIVSTYVGRIQPRQSPIVVGRFAAGVVQAVSA